MPLLSDSTKRYIDVHKKDDVRQLALHTRSNSDIDLTLALQQIEGYQKALIKLPQWANTKGIIYPPLISMEQCSSEATAKYKAGLIPAGNNMADLTGGFGIDFSYLAPKFFKAHYIEEQANLCDLALHNFSILGLGNCVVHQNNAQDFLTNSTEIFDLIYVDPARRDANNRKTFLPTDCSPDLTLLQKTIKQKAKVIMVKYAPMLDITAAITAIKGVYEIHIISVNNECKELLLLISSVSDEHKATDPLIVCANIKQKGIDIFSFHTGDDKNIETNYSFPLKFIYEPNASIMKAGGFHSVANKTGTKLIQQNSHISTSDDFISDFPGRKFEKIFISSLNKKDLKDNLEGISKANITTRNFPMTTDMLRKRLKLKDGGDLYIFATTLIDHSHALIGCRQIFE